MPRLRLFRNAMKWLALLSIVIAATAVLLVVRGDSGSHVQSLIATALGVGLTVLLGTGLMLLRVLAPGAAAMAKRADSRRGNDRRQS